MESYFISMGITVILQMLKGDKKRKYRKAMLKVRNAINTAFLGDSEFHT